MLIAEIGLCHFGSLDKAKELVLSARDSGADAVKTQYIDADEVAKYGSLPVGFYRNARLTDEEHQDLYNFCADCGIPLFFSYFTNHERKIGSVTKYSAKQAQEMSVPELEKIDSDKTIISLGRNFPMHHLQYLKKSHVMYASDYMTVMPLLGIIKMFSNSLERPVGYSDHCISPEVSRIAVRDNNLLCLEKHFYVGDVEKFEGHIIRDTVHAARPAEFSLIAATYKKKQSVESKKLVNQLFGV